jgi:hypothetical protein
MAAGFSTSSYLAALLPSLVESSLVFSFSFLLFLIGGSSI